MILERAEIPTDLVCHHGESLHKVAVESPDKWFIPLEHHNKIVESLSLELRNMRKRLRITKASLTASLFLSVFLGLRILAIHYSH